MLFGLASILASLAIASPVVVEGLRGELARLEARMPPQRHGSGFIDSLRQTVGLKPLYLAERWAVAKVRQEEVNVDATLLAAKAQYELATAEARRIELEAQAKYEKSMAEAERIRIFNELAATASSSLVANILSANTQTPDGALHNLMQVIQQIHMHGGMVEMELPQSELPKERNVEGDTE